MESDRSRPLQSEVPPLPLAARDATIAEAGKWLRQGAVTCERLTESCLRCIKKLDPTLNSFISVTEDLALTTARALDEELSVGIDRGPLHGIPIAYKDNVDTASTPTTCGSEVFRIRVPSKDATLVQRLKAAGTVMLGKTNMNEFAAGGAGGFNKFFGSTRNPWSPDHESGGSSSGSGAAVAARMCLGAVGTDSGGSIRGPASHMGIVGIRPTIGRISLKGVFPRAPSMDCAGPLGRTVSDVAILLNAMIGDDAIGRGAHKPRTEDLTGVLNEGVHGLRLGIVQNHIFGNIDSDVSKAVHTAIGKLARLGAEIVELRVSVLERKIDYLFPLTVMLYEFNEIIGATFGSTKDRERMFGPIVQRDLERGVDITRDMYEAARAERLTQVRTVTKMFENVHALLTPTMPTTAPLIDKPDLSGRHRQFTVPFSFLGLPAVSVPCGFDSRGLPIGLQIVGNAMQEALVLRVAAGYESATAFHERHPPFCCGDVA